jgi:hypothetical protein
MKTYNQNLSANESTTPAEETLRLLARLSPPTGLEERLQAALRLAVNAVPVNASPQARILRWPAALQLSNLWQSSLVRAAAAAAIVAVVVGGGWLVSARFQPAQPATAVALPPRAFGQSGFSSAGAMRTPQTLNGPVVAHPARKPHHRGKSVTARNPLVQPVAPAAK